MMRMSVVTGIFAIGMMMTLPVSASPLLAGKAMPDAGIEVVNAQYTRDSGRAFRRCMRAKYGPRYFHRVPRAHRFHMAQACGG